MKASIEFRRRASNVVVLAVASMALILASCDTVNPTEGIILQEKTVTFRFELDPDEFSPGEEVQVTSEESADLATALAVDGYTKAEVISATVTRVELERISPTSIDLSILEDASLALTASNVSAKTFASSSTSLPASRTASLPLSSSADATSFVIASSFRGSLTLVPVTLPASQVVLRTTVTFRIEVEGV